MEFIRLVEYAGGRPSWIRAFAFITASPR
jgi:hypothetical protein